MVMTDPISDMLTRMRNALAARANSCPIEPKPTIKSALLPSSVKCCGLSQSSCCAQRR